MSAQMEDLTGRRYGRLTVARLSREPAPNWNHRWDCVCDCGRTKTVRGCDLRAGKVQSCGCLRMPNIPAGVHPAVAALVRAAWDQQVRREDLCASAGIAESSIGHWLGCKSRRASSPAVDNLEAALNVLGLTLAVVPLEQGRAQRGRVTS